MKNKLLLIFLLLIPLAYAELQITPSSYDGSVYNQLEKKAEIELRNTFNFIIYDITFNPIEYTTTPTIQELGINETKKINLTVKTDETFSKRNFNSVVKFWYYSDINLEPKTHEVNITNESIEPATITIQVGDKISFTNTGDYPVNIIDQSTKHNFDNIINVNQTVQINFNYVDNFLYKEWYYTMATGRIIVENKSQELVNNPDYNKVFSLSFDSKYTESEIKIEIYPDGNLSMKYNSFDEINVRVWNNGNSTIHNVTLKASEKQNWFSFEENNFDLAENQNRYIDLRITPIINETSDTNKTYEIKMLAESDNAATAETTLRIFIEFTDEIQKIYYGSDFWEAREQFCDNFPNAVECNPPPKIEYREKIIEKNSTLVLSKEDTMKSLRDTTKRLSSIEVLQGKNTKSINTMDTTIQSVITLISQLRTMINESNTIAKKAEEDSNNTFVNFLLVILLLAVSGFLIRIYFVMKRKRQEKIIIGEE